MRRTQNRPLLVFAQMCVKPRKSNVSGLPIAPLLPVSGGEPPELDQPRLVRVQLQPELREPLAKLGEEPLARRPRARNPTTKSSAKRTMITSPCACVTSPPCRPTGRRRSAGRRSRAAATPMPPAVSPPRVSDHCPSSMTPALSHLWISRRTRSVRDPVLEELHQPAVIKLVEEVADVRVEHPVHLLPHDPDRERVQRIDAGCAPAGTRRRSPGSPPRRSALSTSTTARWTILSSSAAMPSGRCRPSAFGMYDPPRRLRPVAPRVHPRVQVPEVRLQVLPVLLPTSPRPPPARPSG